jgi:glycosyl transferase family 61
VHLPLKLTPHIRNIKRLFLGPGALQSTAREIEVLCPEERGEFIPATYLDGQLDKVTAAARGTDLMAQLSPLKNRNIVHAPTIAYHIDDAVLLNGSVYSGSMRHFLYPKLANSAAAAPSHLKTAALASTMLGVEYFGHWLKDDCTQYLLAEEHGALSVPPLHTAPHRSQYGRYFSQKWSSVSHARIDHLIIYQDFSQNSHKRRRYQLLTSRLRSHLIPKSPALVYLKRGITGVARRVANEGEIIEALLTKGFVVVDIASDSLETIVTSLMDAKIVVTMEGSHFWHCWFSPESRSGVITLQPPDRFTSIAKGWLDAVSARFGFVVGNKQDGASSFSVPDVLNTVDLMATDLARSGNR